MFNMAALSKMMQLSPQGVQGIASQAAMKAAPPRIGPDVGGGSILAPGAFAGVMDPTVGRVPQGVQAPPPIGAVPPVAMQGMRNPGVDAAQANVLNNLSQRQPIQFPGASLGQRPGEINFNQLGGPNIPIDRATLAQLLGR